MRITISILFLCILFYSCTKANKPGSHDSLIDYISNEGPEAWPAYSHIIIFCKCDNGEIGYLDVFGLRKGFNVPEYNKLGYSKYVSDVINWKQTIDPKETYISFTLNDTISESYHDNTVENFLKIYTEREYADGEYLLKRDLSYNSTLTFIFYLYQNNYYTSYDDYSGFYSTVKNLPPIIEVPEPQLIILESE